MRAVVVTMLIVAGCGGGNPGGLPDGGLFLGDAARCADDPVPPGGGSCPGVCTACEAGNVCRIECASAACNDTVLTCPTGYACKVVCTGLDACDTTVIECPQKHACSVSCTAYDSCGDLQLRCGSASCSLACTGSGSSDSCGGSKVSCGTGACRTTCAPGGEAPELLCAGSCGCAGC